MPTPIGNLGDITLRAIDVLRQADAVYCEDTRVTGRLLAGLDIAPSGDGKHSRLHRLDENTLDVRTSEVLGRIESGEIVAYCTDAGMPGVSDPGLRLVAAAHEAALPVEVLPGASAAVTAYVLSGSANSAYYFGGFFPRKGPERAKLLESVRSLDAALVFYESPNRVVSALQAIAEAMPCRDVAVCRELTKLHEEVVRGNVVDVAQQFVDREREGRVKGEIAIVIDGPGAKEGANAAIQAISEAERLAEKLSADGASPKAVAKEIAQACGIARNKAYDIALDFKRPAEKAERGAAKKPSSVEPVESAESAEGEAAKTRGQEAS